MVAVTLKRAVFCPADTLVGSVNSGFERTSPLLRLVLIVA